MKRFWFIIATAGLIAGMTAEAAPFYKVQCYDANDKLVNCNDIANVKKHAAKKSTKAKIAKVKKSDALAQKKAREKAIALRALAKQNEELKAEMQALRKANLLAAAKTEEKPANTAQLASVSTTQVPVAPTSTAQIAKWEEEPKSEAQFAGNISDEANQGFKQGDLLANELDIAFDYMPTKHITFEIEQDMYWNWTTGENGDRGFRFDDLTVLMGYSDIYHTEDKLGQLDGHIKLSLPTTQKSRDFGKVIGIEFKGKWKQLVNNSKGFLKFEAKVTPVINRYSTGPTGSTTDTVTVNGLPWEKLAPNTRFKAGFKTIFNHKLVGALAFETSVALDSAYLFADEVTNGDGTVTTIQPAAWSNTIELTLPKFIYTVSDAVKLETKLVTSTSFEEFKMFNTDKAFPGSQFGVYFKISYDI